MRLCGRRSGARQLGNETLAPKHIPQRQLLVQWAQPDQAYACGVTEKVVAYLADGSPQSRKREHENPREAHVKAKQDFLSPTPCASTSGYLNVSSVSRLWQCFPSETQDKILEHDTEHAQRSLNQSTKP